MRKEGCICGLAQRRGVGNQLDPVTDVWEGHSARWLSLMDLVSLCNHIGNRFVQVRSNQGRKDDFSHDLRCHQAPSGEQGLMQFGNLK